MTVNKKWVVLQEPKSQYPELGKDIEMQEEQVPEPKDGEFLVKNLVLTVDPYLRGAMSTANLYNDSTRKLPCVMEGHAVGRIEKSKNPKFEVGKLVSGQFGWQEYAISNGEGVTVVLDTVRPSHALGVLGMPGATAYLGTMKILKPKKGDTIVVSGAAGAVGSLVGQIAKRLGARVVGFAGGAEKVKYLTDELGFDAAIDYKGKTVDQLSDELKKAAPKGVDGYFENTGGPCTEAVLENINRHARIAVCGQIQFYGTENSTSVPLQLALWKELHVEGFIVFSWHDEWDAAHAELQEWLAKGELKAREDFSKGIENTFDAFQELFHRGKSGKSNFGKKIVRLTDDPEIDRKTVSRKTKA